VHAAVWFDADQRERPHEDRTGEYAAAVPAGELNESVITWRAGNWTKPRRGHPKKTLADILRLIAELRPPPCTSPHEAFG
jgi:hypothetical protein